MLFFWKKLKWSAKRRGEACAYFESHLLPIPGLSEYRYPTGSLNVMLVKSMRTKMADANITRLSVTLHPDFSRIYFAVPSFFCGIILYLALDFMVAVSLE